MDNKKIPHTDLYTEAESNVRVARKYHQSLENDCNYIREQIAELQSRLAEKEIERSGLRLIWTRALETLKQVTQGN